jgi:hypothetical protein
VVRKEAKPSFQKNSNVNLRAAKNIGIVERGNVCRG